MRLLFLSWDGPYQSYLESLFFPIFAGLAPRGIRIDVQQLTWASEPQLRRSRDAATALGLQVGTTRIPEPLRKVALPAAVAFGAAIVARLARGYDAVFPRSLIPMSMALTARRVTPGLQLLFDADGFMADERIEFGGWSERGLPYRLLRQVERSGVQRARAVICRTQRAREALCERASAPQAREKIFVVPNSKDAEAFAPGDAESRARVRADHGISPDAPWVVYVGSVGPQYCPRLMLDIFTEIWRARPTARLSCFTFQSEAWRTELRERPELASAVTTAQLSPQQVAPVLAAADLGLAPRRESFSQGGICPIKVAEYLLCGTPVISTRVGDLVEQLGNSAAALLVDPRDPAAASQARRWFLEQVVPQREERRAEARALGLRWFDLARGVESYERALRYGMEARRP